MSDNPSYGSQYGAALFNLAIYFVITPQRESGLGDPSLSTFTIYINGYFYFNFNFNLAVKYLNVLSATKKMD